MIDCHVHMVLDGVDWRAALGRHEKAVDESFVRQTLALWRDKGYTWLRDGGDRFGACVRAKELAPEYDIVYRIPGPPLCLAGHYGGFIGRQFEDLRQYARLVAECRASGADFIKIMISGLMDFDRFGVLTQPGLDPDMIKEMIYIAHEEGFSVMAHANGARTVEAAARAGVDSVEHGAYLDRDALHAMAENRVVWVPTLSTVGNLRGKGRFDEYAVEKILESALVNVEAFAHLGGFLAAGTDAGAWAVPHGCGTEEGLFAMAGVGADVLARGAQQVMERF